MTTLGNGERELKPSGMKVAPQSYAKLEAASIELGKMLPRMKGHRHKVDAWRLLEKTMPSGGYEHRVVKVSELEECAAFTVPAKKLIVLREDVYDGLFEGQTFSVSTVVHEVTHIALKHSDTWHRGAVLGQHRFYEDSEWQAKALTAATMMPIEACRAVGSVAELCDLCGVSEMAACIRLSRLLKEGVIRGTPFLRNEIHHWEQRKSPKGGNP